MPDTSSAHNIIQQLQASPKTRLELFRSIEVQQQGEVLLGLPPRIQKNILSDLHDEEIITAVNYLDPDKATDVLHELPNTRAQRVTEKLKGTIKEKVEFLLRFNPQTAAGLMNLEYIVIQPTHKLSQVAQDLQAHEERTGKFPTILVVQEGKLLGELPGHILALRDRNNTVGEHLRKISTIRYDSDPQRVIRTFLAHPHDKVVVLDNTNAVLGVIHSDDILQFIDKRSSQQLYGFAGVNREEDALDSAWTKVRYRYKWLILNLATAFLAAAVVGIFEETIAAFVILAIYMPIVAGMGGNAGTQAMAVAIRGLALKEVDLKTSRRLIQGEVVAGAVNGAINGLIVAAIAIIFNHSPALGLVLGIAMIANLVIAGFFGAFIPVLMKALGKDPASSATIFITTATDVFGFLVFLGLATLIL